MRTPSIALTLLIAAAWTLGSCQEPADSSPAAPTSTNAETAEENDQLRETPITIGTTLHLDSKVLSDIREINVWTPPSYAEGDKSDPILYLIDGALDQDFQHISGLGQLTTINGTFEELIVVGIQTKHRIRELTHEPSDPRYIPMYPEAGKSADFLEFIRSEVIPLIESRYRAGGRKVLMGESLAGLFVAEVFLKHPDTFTDYIAISPSLWWDDQALAKAAHEEIGSHDGQARQLYLTMANEGGTMQVGLDRVIDAIKHNRPAGLTWHYVDRRTTETHASIYHGAALDELKKLFGVPTPDFGAPPWYLVEGGQPPEAEDEIE